MSEPSDTPTKRIKVIDRRLFDSEGNLRSEVDSDAGSRSPSTAPPAQAQAPAQESGPVAETAVPESPPVPPPVRDSPPARAEQPGPGAPGPGAAPGAGTSPRDLPRDLSAFVESQYYEALLYLGAMPHPATGEVMEDLDMAQYKIDLLGMLEAKTEGNRTPEESKGLKDVLYQLRMLYLQKSKVAKL